MSRAAIQPTWANSNTAVGTDAPRKSPHWATPGQHVVSPRLVLQSGDAVVSGARRSPYRSKRVCCLLRIDGLDSKTCGRFRFLPVATAAAAAIPTGPGKQTTAGESATQLRNRPGRPSPLPPHPTHGSPVWVTRIPRWAPWRLGPPSPSERSVGRLHSPAWHSQPSPRRKTPLLPPPPGTGGKREENLLQKRAWKINKQRV